MLNDTEEFKIELRIVKPFKNESESESECEWMRLNDATVVNILK